jgi:ubiquinone/menaquinone biosynthesis C-methylase UbiE
MKDLFSGHAESYAQYRPTYPPELFRWLATLVNEKTTAWDCGTGNGQVAAELATYFTQVYATDISEQQISQAPQLPNIIYKTVPAESSGFADNSFDLVTIAQAVHWFKFDDFYIEVKRVLKQHGLIAIIGYGLMHSDPETDKIIQQLYSQTLAGSWDAERRYLDEGYQTIPFPFEEIAAPSFTMTMQWNVEQLIGYLHNLECCKTLRKKYGNKSH